MKNLKELAASFNLYQENDIPEQWNNEYCRKDGGREIPEFLKTLKGYEVGNFFECKIQDKGTLKQLYFIEYGSFILIKKNDSDLLLMLREDSRNKKFTFYPYWSYLHKYHNISHYKKDEALKDLKEPNQIGVFTANKVEAWVKYCHDYIEIMDNLYNQVSDKNAVIEKQINDFIDSLPDAKVIKHDKTTYVDTNLFAIRFEHHTSEFYLSIKIEFKGKLDDIVKIHHAQYVN